VISIAGQLHILLVARDEGLREEVESALATASHRQVVLHEARDLTRAVDLARDLSPVLSIVDMPGDIEAFKVTLREIQAVSPGTAIAGAYRSDAFSSEVWEQAKQGAIFVEALRVGARDFLRRPISSIDLHQLIERAAAPSPATAAVAGVMVAFISNKGGVGKTTLAVNVATRLAQRHPGEVLLIDASLQMGICAPMLDLRPKTSLLDTIRERSRLDVTLIRQLTTPHSSGLDLLAAPPDAVSATEIDDEHLSRVLNLVRRSYRYVVVDTFPMFDRIIMAILDAADLGYIVLDNVVPTVLSIVQLQQLLDGLGYPEEKRRIAVNRMMRVSGNPTQADIETTLRCPVDHLLPFDKRAITAANIGRPFALTPGWWSGIEKGLRGIVREIEGLRSGQPATGSRVVPDDREPSREPDEEETRRE